MFVAQLQAVLVLVSLLFTVHVCCSASGGAGSSGQSTRGQSKRLIKIQRGGMCLIE